MPNFEHGPNPLVDYATPDGLVTTQVSLNVWVRIFLSLRNIYNTNTQNVPPSAIDVSLLGEIQHMSAVEIQRRFPRVGPISARNISKVLTYYRNGEVFRMTFDAKSRKR